MNCQAGCDRKTRIASALICQTCEYRALRHLDPAYRAYHKEVVRRRKQRRRGVPEQMLSPLPERRTSSAWTQVQLLAAARDSATKS